MKIAEYEFSKTTRKDGGLLDFINDVQKIINYGRYQLRIVTSVPTWTGDPGELLLYVSSTVRRLYFYENTNSTWQFIEWNNDGLGQPAIVATAALTGQTASIGATTLYTPAAIGTYRVSVYQLCSGAGSGGTLDTTIGWTDNVQAQSSNPAAQVDLTSKGSASSGTIFIQSTAAAITYETTVAGAAGDPEYDLYITVERLT